MRTAREPYFEGLDTCRTGVSHMHNIQDFENHRDRSQFLPKHMHLSEEIYTPDEFSVFLLVFFKPAKYVGPCAEPLNPVL